MRYIKKGYCFCSRCGEYVPQEAITPTLIHVGCGVKVRPKPHTKSKQLLAVYY
jgi:hypothetical protein